MWVFRADPVPRVVCITPDTMQITKRSAHKNGGYARAFAFPLNRMENFGLIAQPGQLE